MYRAQLVVMLQSLPHCTLTRLMTCFLETIPVLFLFAVVCLMIIEPESYTLTYPDCNDVDDVHRKCSSSGSIVS